MKIPETQTRPVGNSLCPLLGSSSSLSTTGWYLLPVVSSSTKHHPGVKPLYDNDHTAVIIPGATAGRVQEEEAGTEQMEIGAVAWWWRQRAGTLRNSLQESGFCELVE